MHRHHRIKQKREVNPFRFTRELECRAIAIERKRPLDSGNADRGLVSTAEEPFPHPPIRSAVDQLQGIAELHSCYHAYDLCWLDASEAKSRRDFFQLHAMKSSS